MEREETNTLVQQLAVGFETLQDEYQKLHVQHQALERKLATARDQVSETISYMHTFTFLQDEQPFSSRSVAVRGVDRCFQIDSDFVLVLPPQSEAGRESV